MEVGGIGGQDFPGRNFLLVSKTFTSGRIAQFLGEMAPLRRCRWLYCWR
jgi:hypothetical protein